jgi:hypothetical protein
MGRQPCHVHAWHELAPKGSVVCWSIDLFYSWDEEMIGYVSQILKNMHLRCAGREVSPEAVAGLLKVIRTRLLSFFVGLDVHHGSELTPSEIALAGGSGRTLGGCARGHDG